jgi:hypothetical protein
MSNIIILTHTNYFTQAKIYSSVGGHDMLHLEGETRVRERERMGGGDVVVTIGLKWQVQRCERRVGGLVLRGATRREEEGPRSRPVGGGSRQRCLRATGGCPNRGGEGL